MKYINPKADLRNWLPVINRKAAIIALLTVMILFLAFPKFASKALKEQEFQVTIQVEDVPITKQEIKREEAPKPKLAEVIETKDEKQADTITLASTEINVNEPPPPPIQEEEIFEFFAVEEKPSVLSRQDPVYPDLARRAGIEGIVMIEFVVDTNGTVLPNSARVLQAKPEGYFEEAALKAIYTWRFNPAMQRDRKVRVRWQQPIRFKLK